MIVATIFFSIIAVIAIILFIISVVKYIKDEGDWLPVVMISLQVVIISIIVICFVLWWR